MRLSWNPAATRHEQSRRIEFAVGPKGLSKHLAEPAKIWVTTLPPHSWLAKVSLRNPFACPLGMDHPAEAFVEARRLLGLALERSGKPIEAAAVYQQSMAAGDDSLDVLRGLGHNLARAGKYDEARPHLEAAHDREQPPTPLTTGFLAVCTARSKTASPTEHAERLAAGIGVLTSQSVRGDEEWLKLAQDLFSEAYVANVKLSPEQLLELAQVFASCSACDQQAALIYDQLAGSQAIPRRADGKSAGDALSFIPAEVAWLYVRAAVDTVLKYDRDEILFDRAFRDRDGARKFFTERQWDFAAAERLFLERWAERREGSYPDAPGPLYPAIAERVLVEESRRLESLGRPETARAALDLAQRLGPTRALTLDRLAEWFYRRGDRKGAEAFLASWIENHPNDPRPLVRRGVLARLDGRQADALKLLRDAGDLANGAAKIKYLVVAARLAVSLGETERAADLIEKARSVGAIDAEVLTALAALWWQHGEFEKLAGIAEDLEAVRGDDPFRGLLAGLCHHLAGDEARAEEALRKPQEDERLRVEAGLLRAIVLGWENRDEEARAVLADVQPTETTRDLVNGLRGQFAWKAGDYAEAVADWEKLPTVKRNEWKLTALWPAAAFLAGIKHLTADQPAESLAAFRQATALGLKDDRLQFLEIRAVQRAIQVGGAGSGAVSKEQFSGLEYTLTANGTTPAAAAWLARGYRRQGHPDEARRLLEGAGDEHPHVLLQRGLLFLQERQLAAAEGEFAAALEKSPDSPAAVTNLALTRLSIGHLDGLPEMLDRAAERTTFGEWRRTLQIFKSLLPGQTSDPALTTLTAPEELRLLWRLQRLGRLETSAPMIDRLAQARPDSAAVQQARAEVQILWTKHLIDRGEWIDAAKIDPNAANSGHRALRNLLGVATCLSRQFGNAIKHFQASLPATGDDARVQQNLALTSVWTGDRARAAAHWKRCQTHLASHCPAPPGDADYLMRLGRAVRRRLEAAEAGTSLPEEVAT